MPVHYYRVLLAPKTFLISLFQDGAGLCNEHCAAARSCLLLAAAGKEGPCSATSPCARTSTRSASGALSQTGNFSTVSLLLSCFLPVPWCIRVAGSAKFWIDFLLAFSRSFLTVQLQFVFELLLFWRLGTCSLVVCAHQWFQYTGGN